MLGSALRRYLMFFVVCGLLGYVYEFCLINFYYGIRFVNGGPFRLPILLIYAVGGVLIIALFGRFRSRRVRIGRFNLMPLLLAVAVLVVVVVVEYTGHWLCEVLLGVKPWDYSDKFMNINGRVCLEDSLRFVVLGMIALYVVLPLIDKALARIGNRAATIVCAVVAAALLLDLTLAIVLPG